MQVLSHLYLHAYLSACSFTACLMSFRTLPEVLLEGVVVSDHQGRAVAHLVKVLQRLLGEESSFLWDCFSAYERSIALLSKQSLQVVYLLWKNQKIEVTSVA